MDRFDWRDGERRIHFGRGRVAGAVDLLGGPGYLLLTTERGRSAAPHVVGAADAILDIGPGRVDELAGGLLGEIGEADRLVALGGGRVIDVAKALAAARRRQDPAARALAVPTTLSGAEMTWVHRHAEGVAADTPRARPVVVICDPALAASQPGPALAASALNALDSSWYGLHHVLSQTLVRLAGVAHGAANAIMLPHTLDALAGRSAGARAALDAALGQDAREFAAAVCARTGATRLGDIGVTDVCLDECADAAAGRDELELTPPRASRDELHALYSAAL